MKPHNLNFCTLSFFRRGRVLTFLKEVVTKLSSKSTSGILLNNFCTLLQAVSDCMMGKSKPLPEDDTP